MEDKCGRKSVKLDRETVNLYDLTSPKTRNNLNNFTTFAMSLEVELLLSQRLTIKKYFVKNILIENTLLIMPVITMQDHQEASLINQLKLTSMSTKSVGSSNSCTMIFSVISAVIFCNLQAVT